MGHPKPTRTAPETSPATRNISRNIRRTPLRRGTALARKPGPRGGRTALLGKYRRKEWRKLRLAVLERDGHRCQIRGPDCDGLDLTVHHERYNRGRGVNRLLVPMEWLVTACATCHAGVERAKRGETVGEQF